MISDTLDIDNLREICVDYYNQSKYASITNGISDVVLTGSFTYGFVRNISDVDLLIYTEYESNHKFLNYTLLVKIFYINSRKYCLYITDKSNFNKKFIQYQLPRYSLISKTVLNLNKPDIISYIKKKSENVEWLIGRDWYENVCGITQYDLNTLL